VISYNGSDWNALELVRQNIAVSPWPIMFIICVWVILAVLLTWIMYDTLGKVGILMLLVLAVISTGWANSAGLIDAVDAGFWQWAGPFIVGIIMALGLTGGYLYRRLTGRIMVDDSDT